MASYTLATHYDPALDARIDDLVARIAKAQRPDGYFNSYFIRREPAKRWTNLRDWHELYCAGHLIEAAVAHAQVTGKTGLIDVMRRYADYIATVFGSGPEPAARLLRPSGDRARFGEALSPHRTSAVIWTSRSFSSTSAAASRTTSTRRRSRAARIRRRSTTARTSTASRTCPVREQRRGRRARGARDVSLQRDGGPCRRVRRSEPDGGLQTALGRPHHEAAVCHRRPRALGAQRGLHRGLRSAERDAPTPKRAPRSG